MSKKTHTATEADDSCNNIMMNSINYAVDKKLDTDYFNLVPGTTDGV